jgi:hypothetical protein
MIPPRRNLDASPETLAFPCLDLPSFFQMTTDNRQHHLIRNRLMRFGVVEKG